MGVAISAPGGVTTEVPATEIGKVNEPPSGDMDGKLPVLPYEWTEGYAEAMLGSGVVRMQSMTRTWLGQVLLYRAGGINDDGCIEIPDAELITAVSERTGDVIDRKFRSGMERARKRVAGVLSGLFPDEGRLYEREYVRLSVNELEGKRLKGGRAEKALTGGLQLARGRVNWGQYVTARSIINTLARGRDLSDREKTLMEKLFENHYYGWTYCYAWIGGPPSDREFENLRAKLPEEYIEKIDDSWVIGKAFLNAAGPSVGREKCLEDVFEIPENEIDRVPLLGVLEGRFAPLTPAPSTPAKPTPKRKPPAKKKKSGGAAMSVAEEVTIGSEISLKEGDSIKILPSPPLTEFELDVLEGLNDSAAVFGLEVETIKRGDSVEVVFLVHNGKFKHNGVRREGGRKPNFTNWFRNITSLHKLTWEIERKVD